MAYPIAMNTAIAHSPVRQPFVASNRSATFATSAATFNQARPLIFHRAQSATLVNFRLIYSGLNTWPEPITTTSVSSLHTLTDPVGVLQRLRYQVFLEQYGSEHLVNL